jgi:predicted DNA binding CopG/RHH family protein
MKRDNHITIRLNDTELEQIDRKASEIGVTRSEYMRIRSIEGEPYKMETIHVEL